MLLQYPRWFFPLSNNRDEILGARERLGGHPFAVELRNASWFNEKNVDRTLRFLGDNQIPFVMVDEPQGFKSSVPPLVAVTSPDIAVMRFHGRRSQTWEAKNVTPAERFRYLYDREELEAWAPRLAAGRQARRASARPDEQLLRQLRLDKRTRAGQHPGRPDLRLAAPRPRQARWRSSSRMSCDAAGDAPAAPVGTPAALARPRSE